MRALCGEIDRLPGWFADGAHPEELVGDPVAKPVLQFDPCLP